MGRRTQPAEHYVSAAAVVVDSEDRVLIVRKRATGAWEIPGGTIERHETVHDALRREVMEETGFTVKPLGLTGVYKNMYLGVVALVFRCELTGGAARTSTETDDVVFLPVADVVNRLSEVYAVRVHDALTYGGWPAVRAHDGQTVRA